MSYYKMQNITDYIDTLDTGIDTIKSHAVIRALTTFFVDKGYIEVQTQNRFSILSACEDPKSVAEITYCGKTWPLPQTGQMWLEYELLTNPKLRKGIFCRTTSYREEKNIIPGRHYVCFPMFEVESVGTFEDLLNLLTELVTYLGYANITHLDYEEIASKYGVSEIEHKHENQMCNTYSPVCFLKYFPDETNPFWNMQRNSDNNKAQKVDVIMSGMETIGCGKRDCDNSEMRKRFYSLCNGEYANLIFEKFGRVRTVAELEEFLGLDKFDRFGFGIGLTRLISSLEKENLLDSLIERFIPQ